MHSVSGKTVCSTRRGTLLRSLIEAVQHSSCHAVGGERTPSVGAALVGANFYLLICLNALRSLQNRSLTSTVVHKVHYLNLYKPL